MTRILLLFLILPLLKQKHLLLPEDKTMVSRERSVANAQPVIIEIIKKSHQTIDLPKLKQLLSAHGINPASIYQWQNHYVVFDKVPDLSALKSRIKKALPGIEMKSYRDPFYTFTRKYCSDTDTSTEWDHVILTANLVNNSKLQQEYMDYHATQFEKWPEVAKGFCNAKFQQLLVFRNGRQLMLVISIPKGASLDELNPKTTENNPRVDEWNALMKKYQAGIAGTKPGETRVFMKRL